MSKLSEWGRWLWLEAELTASPTLQRTVLARLNEAKEIGRLVTRPLLTLQRWQGQGRGGPLTVDYVGLGYARPFMKHLLFVEEPSAREIGRVPFWSLGEEVASLEGDITIVEASKHLIRGFSYQGAVSLPFRLHHVVDLQRDWEEVWRSFGKSARKQDVRLVRKHGYGYELSRNPDDLETFYHTMYVPTTTERHGDLASLVPIERVHQYFRHGLLILVKRDGQIVSGGLCSVQKKTVYLSLTGVLNADHQLSREGAVAVIYYFLIRWAHEAGYHTVNLGACWPFLADGIFQFKRKWGASVILPPREHKLIWMRVRCDTPAVNQFITENPCVVVGDEGQLQGLVVVNSDDITLEVETECRKRYATSGLSDLVICSVTDLLQRSGRKNGTGGD
jgi:hypothetical protein